MYERFIAVNGANGMSDPPSRRYVVAGIEHARPGHRESRRQRS
jgi:hypothetical protein